MPQQAAVFSAAFVLVYLYVAIAHNLRGLVVWLGAGLAVAACLLAGLDVDFPGLFSGINYNVLMIFSGILIIAEVMIETGVPGHLAGRLISLSGSYGAAALLICGLSSVISVFVENVATVMIVAPIALEVTRRLDADPVPLLIGIAIASNLQGTATLVGDPPSMILAASENMGFNDFIFFMGKPGIFFAVQAGAVASFGVLYYILGRDRRKISSVRIPLVTSWTPTFILGGVIAGLALLSIVSPGVSLAAGLLCMGGALVSIIWHAIHRRDLFSILRSRPTSDEIASMKSDNRRSREILMGFDFDTLFLLAGIFFMVTALELYGVMEEAGRFIAGIAGSNPFSAFLIIVWGSVIFSAFVDNVPFVTAMIPVTHAVARAMGTGSHLYLVFGLLVGSCLGGNISPVGASANIVSVAILRRNGYKPSFGRFVSIGLPFTIAATLAGSLFVWFVWHP